MNSKKLPDFMNPPSDSGIMCTIVKIIGSVPQEVGAKMWVTPKNFEGTIGGGEFEHRVLNDARRMLETAQIKAKLKEYTLCKEMNQCCGGRVEVFFEPVAPRQAVHLFGAGHVGRATAQVLSGMSFDMNLIDPRPEWANTHGLPQDIRVHLIGPLEYAKGRSWNPQDAVCIFTHSHDLDFLLAYYFLEQPVGYLGLIGSQHKARVFQARLTDHQNSERLTALWEEKMHCPIGIPLAGKNPKVIAVSIAAQLLESWGLREEKTSSSSIALITAIAHDS